MNSILSAFYYLEARLNGTSSAFCIRSIVFFLLLLNSREIKIIEEEAKKRLNEMNKMEQLGTTRTPCSVDPVPGDGDSTAPFVLCTYIIIEAF